MHDYSDNAYVNSLLALLRQFWWGLHTLASDLQSGGHRLFWAWLAIFFAYLFWQARKGEVWRGHQGQGDSLWARAFPRAVWLHPSNRIDIAVIVINSMLGPATWAMPIVSSVVIGTWVSGLLSQIWPSGWQLQWNSFSVALFTLIAVIVTDFKVYVVHRAFHEIPWLWPFHALHHSAEVLTPVTAYRNHPINIFVASLVRGLFVGVMLGVIHTIMLGKAEAMTLLGANAAYLLLFMPMSNFRHSHVWIDYPRWLSRWLVSPAMHQIHHSRLIEHHDKNYGEVFSCWDRWLGTLGYPRRDERFTIGLYGVDKQPYHSVASAYFTPFKESWQVLKTGREKKHGERIQLEEQR